MTEYNTASEDEARHHPGDQHVAGSRWGEEPAGETGGPTEGEPVEDGAEPHPDEEPVVEHVSEEPVGEHGIGEHAGEHVGEHAGEHGAEPVAGAEPPHDGTGSHWDEEPAGESAGTLPGEEPVEAAGAAGGPAWSGAAADEHAPEPTAAEEPAAAAIVADAAGAGSGARPTAADDLTVDRLLDEADAERFHNSWRDVKSGFVDDPADALRRASSLSEEVVDELTAALGRLRQNLDDHWQTGGDDTERLRIALRGYGSLLERLLAR
jgi:hypothetical protein